MAADDGVHRDGGFRDGGHRDGGFRDGGPRHVDDVVDRRGHLASPARTPPLRWERVCFRNRWGVKRCHMERVCRSALALV